MNVIADDATLGLSVRSFDRDVRALLQKRITEIATAQAASYGAVAEVDYGLGHPVLVNSDDETEFARQVAEETVGGENVAEIGRITGSEDFAYMLEQRPGCLIRIGNGTGTNVPLLHTSRYDFNDENLVVGAAFWVKLVQRFLEAR
jgi:hippurate hydrolase